MKVQASAGTMDDVEQRCEDIFNDASYSMRLHMLERVNWNLFLAKSCGILRLLNC